MPACETDAQKQNLQRKCLKTSFKTPETLGKVKKHSMGHIRGFYGIRRNLKKSDPILSAPATKYMPISHSTKNSQSLNDNSEHPALRRRARI